MGKRAVTGHSSVKSDGNVPGVSSIRDAKGKVFGSIRLPNGSKLMTMREDALKAVLDSVRRK